MIEAILLGTAQDAGLPQAGCSCANCQRAWADPGQRQFVVSLGLVDHTTRQSWLIDATPDFREQLHALDQLAPACPLAGILLTHAHIGHYTGLIHLGREVMNTTGLLVYVIPELADFLSANAPWSQLISLGNIKLQLLAPSAETQLSPNLSALPLLVPHRAEFSPTVAFVIRGPKRRLFYCPDIDSWAGWEHDLRSFVAALEVALLDASFFSAVELPNRDQSEIPHPLATDTAARLSGVPAEVHLIHLNHTNPLYQDGPERAWLTAQGLHIGRFGARWQLG